MCLNLAVLMKESRLTTLQRKSLLSNLRSGGSSSTTISAASINRPAPKTNKVIKQFRSFRPRTLKDIVESGAYQPEAYVPNPKKKNYVAEKEKLQSIMTNGKETKMHNTEKKKQLADRKKPQEHTIEELIDLTISDIEDREQFLLDMEQLGKGSISGPIIHEIRHRIKTLESIINRTTSKYRATDLQNIAEKYRKPLGIPKPLPGFVPPPK
uniref:UPF0193 protein EVG1 n=1 Tax=Sipha flava TaxID=143950 RepID=A0A2S2R0P2_9HEMI